MFTWVCPQCGREVPPHYDECPDCKGKTAAPPAGQSQPTAPPGYPPPAGPDYPPPPGPPQQFPPTYYQQPPQAPQPGQPYYQPQQAPPPGPQYYAPPPQQQAPPPPQYYQPPPQPPQYYPKQPQGNLFARMPAWLLTILFALGIGGIIFGLYSVLQSGKPTTAAGNGPAPTAAVESPAAKPGAKPNPLQKQIEISGVRFSQDAKKKTLVTFMVTNHSTAEITGLAGNVTIWGRTQKSEEDAQGTFTFTTDLAPFQSKEMSAPLNSKLKIYELPDWQNITTDIQITSPAG